MLANNNLTTTSYLFTKSNYNLCPFPKSMKNRGNINHLFEKIITKNIPSKLKKIFLYRDKRFFKEYLLINKLSFSTSCQIKTDCQYINGILTINNNILTVTSFYPKYINDYNKFSCVSSCNNNLNNNQDELIMKENLIHPIFTINFDLVTCRLEIHNKKQKFRLLILGNNTNENDYYQEADIDLIKVIKFKLEMQNSKIFKHTCFLINKCIMLSKGFKKNLISINLRNNFYKEYFITNDNFIRESKTGDILLFRGISKKSKIQRFITQSECDHVALIIKNKKKVYLFDSTTEGVKKKPWTDFDENDWILYYEKIIYRPLIIQENKMKNYIYDFEIEKSKNLDKIKLYEWINNLSINQLKFRFNEILNEKIDTFVENTLNKKYSFKKTGFVCHSTMKKNAEKRNGYSCSELVAACYFFCGVISGENDAIMYLPRNFCIDGNMAFEKGFSFEKEFILDFSG